MLEQVLLRYSNETLNGYCYVNISLDYLFCYFIFRDRQLEKRCKIFIICHAIDINALLLGLVTAPEYKLNYDAILNRSKCVTDVSATYPRIRLMNCSVSYIQIKF